VRTTRVLLVGMMGAGKTTVGEFLAARFGWRYFDSDALVEARTGQSVVDLFEAHGEVGFRGAETEALRQSLQGEEPAVISVAGGAVLAEENRQLLRQAGAVVWLRARLDTLAARLGDGAGRPLLEGDVLGNLTRLDAVRRPLYEEVADLVVDVDGRSVEEVADDIVGALP
jgi:shikimate kinase